MDDKEGVSKLLAYIYFTSLRVLGNALVGWLASGNDCFMALLGVSYISLYFIYTSAGRHCWLTLTTLWVLVGVGVSTVSVS